MYTIIRFTAEPARISDLLEIGQRMNAIRAGVFDGPRRRGDGFACSICSDDAWHRHVAEIQAFIAEFRDAIAEAVQMGASVTVDTAIEPEDQEKSRLYLVVGCSADLLGALAAAGVRLELTVYSAYESSYEL